VSVKNIVNIDKENEEIDKYLLMITVIMGAPSDCLVGSSASCEVDPVNMSSACGKLLY
jgi:hypothetical protein